MHGFGLIGHYFVPASPSLLAPRPRPNAESWSSSLAHPSPVHALSIALALVLPLLSLCSRDVTLAVTATALPT
jgi:energy-converting hydrogenase Eha subunit A